jgi:phosphonate transport system substrate-binding protein
MKKLFLLALTALTVMTLGLATACGGDDDEPSSSSTGSNNTGASSSGAASGGSSQVASNQGAAPTATVDPKEGWPDTFRLGLFGGDDAEEVVLNAQPMKELLEEALGIPVEIFTGTSYSAVIEAMRADKVEAMTVGPFSYILAVQEAQAEAVAVGIGTTADPPVYNEGILPYYVSVIFTKKGNGIEKIDDIKGKGFNFVDPASTSGHLAPKTKLISLGYDPDNDFQTVFAGSHPTSVLSVWEDKAPAGATNEGNLRRLDLEGQVDWCEWPDGQYNIPRTQEEVDAHFESCPDGTIVILAQTDPIPNTPFAVRTELPDSLKDAVREALLSTPENSEFISARKAWYVDPSGDLGLQTLDQFYNPLRDIAKLLDLDLKELAEGG